MAFLCVAVALNSTLFAWWTFSEFGVRLAVEAELDVLRLELDGIEPQLAHHGALQRERARHARREQTLRRIATESISWTAKLDQLTDVVTVGDEEGRHMVWFSDLSADISSERRGEEGGVLRAGGVSGSERFAEVADFLDDLVASPFGNDLGPPAPPEGSASLVDSDLQPPLVWSFPLQLALNSSEDQL
jgi:hypothetical protein